MWMRFWAHFKTYCLFGGGLVALILPTEVRAQIRQVVAVVDVESTTEQVKKNEATFLSETVRRVVGLTLPESEFTLLSKEVMDILVPPEEQAACEGTLCLAEFGRQFQADFVVGGTVSSFDGSLTLTLNCYETRSGELLGTAQRVGPTPSDLLGAVDMMVPEVIRRLLPAPSSSPDRSETSDPSPPESEVVNTSNVTQPLSPAVLESGASVKRPTLAPYTRLAIGMGGAGLLSLGVAQAASVQAEEAYGAYMALGEGTTQDGFDAAWDSTMRLKAISMSGRILAAGLVVGGGITWVFGDGRIE